MTSLTARPLDDFMDHDVKTLTVLMEQQFASMKEMANRMHTDNQAVAAKQTSAIDEVQRLVSATNGRVSKLEINMAVLRFAVFVIGGSLLLSVLDVVKDQLFK